MTKQQLREFYTGRLQCHQSRLRRLRYRGRLLVMAQLVMFFVAIGFVVAFASVGVYGGLWLALAGASAVGYGVARWQDGLNTHRMSEAEDKCSVYQKELKALATDYSDFDDGKRYVDPHHDYTFDMDIFGPQSLYHRMCRCVTTGGADALARSLSTCALDGTDDASVPPLRADRLKARRAAILELADDEPWRTQFMAYGQRRVINTKKVMEAMEAMRQVHVPSWVGSPVALGLALASCLGFWVAVVLSVCTPLGSYVPVWWGLLQLAVVCGACMGTLKKVTKVVDPLCKQLKGYVMLMKTVAQLDAKAEANRRIVRMMADPTKGALDSLGRLGRILDALDRRGNVLCLLLFNMTLLSDYFLMRSFLRWQRDFLDSVEPWIAAMSEMDERVSLATYCYNHSGMCEPEVVCQRQVLVEAQGLAHPFLGEKAVPNDFTIADGHYYIITGANMAGKSTFLRSVGINYVLAMVGMPVFAKRFRVSLFALFSSMRTSDDLAHGISYFNAELLRLRQLIETCKRNHHTLIILDEILKGTNSLDKLNGSRMFLNAISTLPVTGVIATHDLELSRMADNCPSRYHNYCFEIGLSDDISYTYKITPGVARNQNATYLLENIIKDLG